MRKLRLYFVLFAVLLAIPIAVLLIRTYSNLEQEAFFFYRRVAEGGVSMVSTGLLARLEREERRPYTHYRYVHVADRPVPKQEGLNLSPLAGFPVESQIPGMLGYYQIDPDGSFSTPLLPIEGQDITVDVPEQAERRDLRDRLALIVESHGPYPVTAVTSVRERYEQEPADAESAAPSILKENLESNVDLSLEQEYFRTDSQDAQRGQFEEADEKKKDADLFERRVQKASPRQAQVFESQLKEEAYPEGSEDMVGRSAPADAAKSVAGKRVSRGLDAEGDSATGSDQDSELGAEVESFSTRAVSGDWLVFQRNVWWNDQRYIQGFVTQMGGFLDAFLEPLLLNAALPEGVSYLLFYQGEVIRSSGIQVEDRPVLLYSASLPYPLSDFHLAIAVDRLPKVPGHQTVTLLAALLSVLFVGGLFGIYRVTAAQVELSQKKSDFVSSVSHELKSPLTSIRMYGEILMEGWAEDDKKERYYRYIHDESERLSRLIQNVLTLSQLERKEWQSNLAVLNPVEFAKEIVDRLASQVRRAGFEISVATEGNPLPVQVDEDALTQVLINLIDNAIKFSKKAETKKIVLTVSQPNSECYIRVRDFGPGIPRQQLKKIFEKFYRIESEMTRTTSGTGIGLSLVRMLADSMGAEIDVRNCRPGTEFSIRLKTASA
jgi:signal transduction histidine kinase